MTYWVPAFVEWKFHCRGQQELVTDGRWYPGVLSPALGLEWLCQEEPVVYVIFEEK